MTDDIIVLRYVENFLPVDTGQLQQCYHATFHRLLAEGMFEQVYVLSTKGKIALNNWEETRDQIEEREGTYR